MQTSDKERIEQQLAESARRIDDAQTQLREQRRAIAALEEHGIDAGEIKAKLQMIEQNLSLDMTNLNRLVQELAELFGPR